MAINCGETPAAFVGACTDPNEQESVVMRPELDAKVSYRQALLIQLCDVRGLHQSLGLPLPLITRLPLRAVFLETGSFRCQKFPEAQRI